MAVFTGALWPGDRLGTEDPVNKCPHCQRADDDEVHMFYTCLALVASPTLSGHSKMGQLQPTLLRSQRTTTCVKYHTNH
eukprot:5542561-Karenia_brevis.AAC.1